MGLAPSASLSTGGIHVERVTVGDLQVEKEVGHECRFDARIALVMRLVSELCAGPHANQLERDILLVRHRHNPE